MKRTWNLAGKGWLSLAAAGVLASCLLSAAPASADDSDIFRFRATPNVLLIVDDSGSMGRTSGGSNVGDLDGVTDTSAGLAAGASSRVDVAYRVLYQLLNGDGSAPGGSLPSPFPTQLSHVSGAYAGSYNNNLTRADEDAVKLRLGLMIYGPNVTWNGFQYISVPVQINGGDSNLPPFTTSYSSFWTAIKNNLIVGNNPTSMARSLQAAPTYFTTAGSGDGSAACRKKFVVLITDGEDTIANGGTGNVPKYYGPGGGQPDLPGDANYGVIANFDANGYPGFTNSDQKARNTESISRAKLLADANVTLFVVGIGMKKDGGRVSPAIAPQDRPHLKVLRQVLRRMAEQKNNNLTSTEYANVASGTDDNTIGAGKAFFADDATELLAALQASFDSIILQSYSFTAPVVPAVRTTDSNRLYLASFIPDNPPETFWAGSCASINLNPDGSVPVNLTPATNWDAGTKLDSTNRIYSTNPRKVYTASGSGSPLTRQDFSTSNGWLDNNVLSVPSAVKNNLIDNVVLRSSRTKRLGDIYHSTPVIIGSPSKFFSDTGFSTAVGSSLSFRDTNAARQRVLYVGANDGMLHAFNAGTFDNTSPPGSYNTGTGEELFAYVPKNLLPNLKNMTVTTTSTHQYMVDSSPKAADVWLDTNGDNLKQTSEWKTVLIAGERKGGRGLFALDVTSPQSGTANYPKVMWEIDNAAVPNLGQTWSEPNIGLVQIREGGVLKDRWVAFVGGGYWYSTMLTTGVSAGATTINIVDNTGFAPSVTGTLSIGTDNGISYGSTSATTIMGIPSSGSGRITTTHTAGEIVTYSPIGRGFYVIDIKLGKVIWSYGPSDNVNMRYPITASPTAVDINSDGRVNYVYVVDTGNQLWRFDVGTAGTFDNTIGNERITGGWTAARIFSPSSPAIAQRSFNKVDVAFDAGLIPWIFFGTGDREKPEDQGNGNGRIYAIRDGGTGYPYDESNLANLSSVFLNTNNAATGTITATQRGWYADFPTTYEKSLSDVVVFNNNLFFTTFTSDTTNLCGGGGAARLYAINTGLMQANAGASMTAGAGAFQPDSGGRVRSTLLTGGGIPSSPVISMSASGGARLYVGTTNSASVLSFAIDSPPVFKKIKSWKEYIDQP